jgi:hypothetical protein
VCGESIGSKKSDAGRKINGMERGIEECLRFNPFQMRRRFKSKRGEVVAFGKALELKKDDGVRNGKGSERTVKKGGLRNCGKRGGRRISDCVKRGTICKTGGRELFK